MFCSQEVPLHKLCNFSQAQGLYNGGLALKSVYIRFKSVRFSLKLFGSSPPLNVKLLMMFLKRRSLVTPCDCFNICVFKLGLIQLMNCR